MSFPLIVNESPLQQLANMLRGMNERRDVRRSAAEDAKRRDAYLTMNQQEARLNEDRFAYQQSRDAQTDREQAAAAALAQAQFKESLRVARMNEMRQAAETRRQLTQMVLNNLPPGFSMDALTAGRITDSGDPTKIQNRMQRAQAASRPGRQGAIARDPVPGTAEGVTFTPETLHYNPPANSGGGRAGGTTQDRLMQAAIGGALEQVQILEDLERRNPMNATIPALTATIEGAGSLPLVGSTLRGALGPASQRAMTAEQQQYQASAGEFIHTYASSLPGRRLGPELLKVIHHNFFPRSGQTDPATIRQFTARRREAAVRMARAAAGQPVDLESLISPLLRAELDRVAPREDGGASVEVAPLPAGVTPAPTTPRRRVILR